MSCRGGYLLVAFSLLPALGAALSGCPGTSQPVPIGGPDADGQARDEESFDIPRVDLLPDPGMPDVIPERREADGEPTESVETDVCVPWCAGKECGDDGCGGSCGTCGPGPDGQEFLCVEGDCVCQPECNGKQCGPDGCGGECGICPPNHTCTFAGTCLCIPDCAGKECGTDGCGGNCGLCPFTQGTCINGKCYCEPSCAGKECGDDGCGGSCGWCESPEPCFVGVCTPDFTCEIQPSPDCPGDCAGDDSKCDDGDACTLDDCVLWDEWWLCQVTFVSCDDWDECTWDYCEPDTAPGWDPCVHTPVPDCGECGEVSWCQFWNDPICDDGDPCTVDECAFAPGKNVGCCLSSPLVCSDCEVCKPGKCVPDANGMPLCIAGEIDCDDGNPCTIDACDCAVGCVHGLAKNGSPCGAAGEVCQGGQCVCVPKCDGKECGADGCGGQCGPGCAAGAVCLKGKCAAAGGACEGLPPANCCEGEKLWWCKSGKLAALDCAQYPKCGWFKGGWYDCSTDGLADPTGTNPKACSCTPDCSGKQCGTDGCGGECGSCDDGDDKCTLDKCVQGKCTYESTGAEGCCQPTIFFDDFSTDKGWEYGPEWERGSATASVGQSYNGPDPSSDHTSSDDNMIAGVVIGGNEAQSIHEYYYLTSPIIDLSYSAAPLLVFWRWLNSDYLPYMQNVVEVFAGKSWVKLWETGGSPGVADAAWTFIQYDVAAYANPEFRVRFGFRIGSGGVFAVSSWNVDDVMIWDQGIGGAPMCCQYDSQCEGLFKPAACVAGGCQK